MGVLAVITQTAQTYPVLLSLILATALIAVWAHRRKNWWAMGGAVFLCGVYVVFYAGDTPAGAAARLTRPETPIAAVIDKGTDFHSTTRLHPRFPDDFPIPPVFLLEYSHGGMRHGAMTLRFRFKGDPKEAVEDLAASGESNGWTVKPTAPHRVVFTKDARSIEAWFGFPGRSLVLDVPDPR